MQIKEEYAYLLVLIIVAVVGMISLNEYDSFSTISGYGVYEDQVQGCIDQCELSYDTEKTRIEREIAAIIDEINDKTQLKNELEAVKSNGKYVRDAMFLLGKCKKGYEKLSEYTKSVNVKRKRGGRAVIEPMTLNYKLCIMKGTKEPTVKTVRFLSLKEKKLCKKPNVLRPSVVALEGQLCMNAIDKNKIYDLAVQTQCKTEKGYEKVGTLKTAEICAQRPELVDDSINQLSVQINELNTRKTELEQELEELEPVKTSCINVCNTDLAVTQLKFVDENGNEINSMLFEDFYYAKIVLTVGNVGTNEVKINPVNMYEMTLTKDEVEKVHPVYPETGENVASVTKDYDVTEVIRTNKEGTYCAKVTVDNSILVDEIGTEEQENTNNLFRKCITITPSSAVKCKVRLPAETPVDSFAAETLMALCGNHYFKEGANVLDLSQLSASNPPKLTYTVDATLNQLICRVDCAYPQARSITSCTTGRFIKTCE